MRFFFLLVGLVFGCLGIFGYGELSLNTTLSLISAGFFFVLERLAKMEAKYAKRLEQ